MNATTTPLEIPDDLRPADGRFGCGPSKVRPEQLAHLAAEGAAIMGTSHRQRPVKDVVGRVRGGLRELFSLPDGYEVALGNGGTTAFWDAAAFGLVRERALHLTYGEFSAKFAKVTAAAPFLQDSDRPERRPGRRPRACRRPGGRRRRLGAQRDVDRRDGPACAGPPTQATRSCSIDATSGAGGLPLDAAQADVYYFAPQKCFAADGGLWLALLSPAALRAHRASSHGSERWIPDFLSLATALDNARKDQTYNTPAVATPAAARRPGRVDARQRRPGLVRVAHAPVVRAPLRLGAGQHLRDAVRGRRGQALARGRRPSTSQPRSTPPPSRRRCAPTGSSTSSPTASSDATSCAWAVPGDRARRRAGADGLHRLGRRAGGGVTRVLVAEKIGASGVALLREHFDVDDGRRRPRPRSPTTTGS